ncbi:MAG: hypothetical protein ACRDU5_02235 [Mycobacterium sp.]
MAVIGVDPAALRAAAGQIDGVAATFTAARPPNVPVLSAQATTAAVNVVHAATNAAVRTTAARLRSTASAMAAGGTAFATTERASRDAITTLTAAAG